MTSTSRRMIILIGSVLATLVVLSLALPALGRILENVERTTHELPTDLASLTVDTGVGDVEVRLAGPGEEPGAVATVRTGLADASTEAAVSGDSVTLTDHCRDLWFENCSVTWAVLVPAGTALTVESAVGDVTVADVTGPVSLSADVGSITATGLGGERVHATSSVGDVTLDLATPPTDLRVISSTGDVTVTVPADGATYRVTTSASVGEVSNAVGSDDTSTRALDISTSVGDIIVRRAG